MALGAQRRDVLAMLLRQASIMIGTGLAAGYVASMALARLLASLLYEVQITDMPTSLIVALILGAVAMAGSYIPARRAMGLDPMVALRCE
jgi:ABC-type antimicrobial peptide transport system permease subunit